MKNLKLFVIALNVFFVIAVLSSCKPMTSLEYHQGLQSHYNYENAKKRNKAYTVESAEYALKMKKESLKGEKKRLKEVAKRESILAKIKELEEN